MAVPETVADDRNIRPAFAIFFGKEAAAFGRSHAENVKEAGRGSSRGNLFRCAVRGKTRVKRIIRADALERARLLPDARHLGKGNREAVDAALHVVSSNRNELIGIFIRQRKKQHGVNDGENRGVGADAQRKREDSDNGEAGILPQHARAETQILQQGFDHGESPSLAINFLGLLHTAQPN